MLAGRIHQNDVGFGIGYLAGEECRAGNAAHYFHAASGKSISKAGARQPRGGDDKCANHPARPLGQMNPFQPGISTLLTFARAFADHNDGFLDCASTDKL